MLEAHSSRTANALAYDFFLALIPMLGLAGWFASTYVAPLLPDGSAHQSVFASTPREIRHFLDQNMNALSGAELAPFATLSGLWLSSSAFDTFFAILSNKPKPAWKQRLVSLGFAALGLALLAVASTIGVVLTLDSLGILGHLFPALGSRGSLRLATILLGLVSLTAFVSALYRVALGSSMRVGLGATVAVLTGSFSSLVLAYFTTKLGNYALYYGGLAAVVGLLVWLWTWCWALLLGAHLCEALAKARPKVSQRVTSVPEEFETQTPKSVEKSVD